MNKAIVYGRITQDLELKSTPSGLKIVSFSVATNESYIKDGQKVEKTEFHNITAFNKTAESIAKYFVKGQMILVEGKLQTQSWEDKNTGKKVYKTEIILMSFSFGEKPKSRQEQYNEGVERLNNSVKKENNYREDSNDIDPSNIPF